MKKMFEKTTLAACAAAMAVACGGTEVPEVGETTSEIIPLATVGRVVFERREFQGNGRICRTCHLRGSGTVSPDDVEAAFQSDPNGDLFRAIDSDDGLGLTYDRLRNDATFRVFIPLPSNVTIVGDPSATTALVHRGASATLNNPGLESIFMQDGRNATLQEQAAGAVNAHYEPGRQPTQRELDGLDAFQRKRRQFYSSGKLFRWGLGIGSAPSLPAGNTPSEIRGRAFFEDTPAGLCGHCHGGPNLNETTANLLLPFPPGTRFITIAVSERNLANNPVYDFAFEDPANPAAPPVVVSSPDPGRALISGDPADANAFRIPSLWGLNETAPYFHDNSAKDLEEVMEHYRFYFSQPPANLDLTDQQVADMIAYMKLL
ncbi:MAG: hypothetical protein RIT81_24605 [Deltaproteobacteria bacterium]